MKKVKIYTDGACSGNPGPGGWGVLLICDGHERTLSGYEPDTTNNRMELAAAINALAALKEVCEVELITDSEYVKNGINVWMAGWKQRGWKTAAKKPVKNQDLWEQLDAEAAKHNVNWHWVKGHSGDPGNERADALARDAIENARQ